MKALFVYLTHSVPGLYTFWLPSDWWWVGRLEGFEGGRGLKSQSS